MENSNESVKKVFVDFNAKDKARQLGNRVENGEWIGSGDQGSDRVHAEPNAILKDFAERLLDDDCKTKKTVSEAFCKDFSVPPECLCDEEEDASWKKLLDYRNWNALVAVMKIKEKGLPRSESQRAEMLNYFASVSSFKTGEQYNVTYKELCDYCDKFREAYGFEKVIRMQREYGIDGFNFNASINKSKMTDEMKALFRFVFPINVKTIIRETGARSIRRESASYEEELSL